MRDCSPTLWVTERGDYTTGLIEKHDSLGRRVNWATINLNTIHIGIYLGTQLRAHLSVDLHAPFDDETLHLSTRAHTTLSEKLL